MATAVQFRRGNTAQTAAFTGALAEVTVDTDKDVVVVHDGVTAGGFPGARESVVITVSNKTDSAYNKANSANVLAQAGYDQANTVYDWANSAFNKANSANVLAQTAYDQANTGTTIAQAGFNKANSANVLAQQAYDQANTGTTIAQAGFDKANSANVLAQQAYDQANTGTSLAQTAYDQANTGTNVAQAGFDKANSANVLAQTAYDQANAGTSLAQAGFDKANSANVLAQQAYDQANTGSTVGQSAFDKANTAIVLNDLTIHLGDTANISRIWGTDYNNPNMVVPRGDDTAWAYGAYGNVATDTYFMQVKFWGGDNKHGFRVYNTDSNTVPFKVDGTGNVTADKYVANSTITIKTYDILDYANASFDKANSANVLAQQAYDRANNAYDQANAANTLADSKFAKVGGIITGNVEIQGNLVVSGNVTTVSANNLVIQDNMLYLNEGASITNPDLGIAASYYDGTYQHTGIFRDATDGYWKIFDHYTPEPDASIYIDTDHASFRIGNFRANIATDVISVRGFDPLDRANSAYDKANAANVMAQAGFDKANSANVLAQQAYDQANTGTSLAQTAYDQANTGTTTAQASYNQANTGTTVAQSAYNQANTGTTVAQSAHDVANTANSVAANSVQTTGSTMTGTLTVPSLTANASVTINTNMYLGSTTHTLATGGVAGAVDTWSSTSYRSAKYFAQMTNGSSYHLLEINVIHDGTTVYISQFGEVKTGASLGSFDGLISGGTFSLMCTAGNNGTVVKLARTLIPV